jgi:cysteine desulfurase
LGAHSGEVVFTSGATEADNLAVLGMAEARRQADPQLNRVLISAVEHPAVRLGAAELAARGFEVTELPVDSQGLLRLGVLSDALRRNPKGIALLSCLWVNNEMGAIAPIPEIAALADSYGIPLHSDAVQAVGLPSITFAAATLPGLSGLSISAHKIGGPMGIGALLIRRDAPIVPLTYGGGQERRIRSGTVPVALIAAFAAALDEVVLKRELQYESLRQLRNTLSDGLTALGANVIGPAHPNHQAPHILYAIFPGVSAETLLMLLDQAGIAASAGSACSAGVIQPSETLLAMGYTPQDALSGVRFSLGWTNTPTDITTLLQLLPDLLTRASSV